MVKVSLSKDEYKYLRNVVETDDIRFDSISGRAKNNKNIIEKSKIVDSLKKKLSNAEPSNSYSLR